MNQPDPTETDETTPVCKFEQGCHRVVPCDPGCGVLPQPAPAATRSATPSAAIRKTLRRWAYAAGYIKSELDVAAERMYAAIERDIAAQSPAAPVVPPAPTSRADVLLWAAEQVTGYAADHFPDEYDSYADALADELRRLAAVPAAAEEQPESETPEVAPPAVCQGFVWIGQSFDTCERCGQPAWDHEGEEVPVEGAGPFDPRRTVRPWKAGEADAIRAKWAPRSEETPS